MFTVHFIRYYSVFTFLPWFFLEATSSSSTGVRYAVIRIHGKEVDRFNLDEVKELTKTYYPGKDQYNTIEIKNGEIRDKEDNSPDQIGVKRGWISKKGQTIICLPHSLLIEIHQDGVEDYYIY
ncbi:NusG domain II-containing protein [Enterococcus sp. AZ126]|uniref:NusG domain II-containing protein n=1 Tax=Enterococcus sp. AZ126 TaxID=2774635 RepID=UPI003F685ADD